MKKTILGAMLLTMIVSASAAEMIEVSKIEYRDNKSFVSVIRYSTTGSNRTDFWSMVKVYVDKISAQQAVDKVSMDADSNINTTSKLDKVTDKAGQVQAFAELRRAAYYKGGYADYFLELTRQNELAK